MSPEHSAHSWVVAAPLDTLQSAAVPKQSLTWSLGTMAIYIMFLDYFYSLNGGRVLYMCVPTQRRSHEESPRSHVSLVKNRKSSGGGVCGGAECYLLNVQTAGWVTKHSSRWPLLHLPGTCGN